MTRRVFLFSLGLLFGQATSQPPGKRPIWYKYPVYMNRLVPIGDNYYIEHKANGWDWLVPMKRYLSPQHLEDAKTEIEKMTVDAYTIYCQYHCESLNLYGLISSPTYETFNRLKDWS